MDPKTAKVTEKGGLELTKAEDGKYTAEVDFEQKLTLVSELLGYDKVEKEVEIAAEDKTEALVMSKKEVHKPLSIGYNYKMRNFFSVYLKSIGNRF